MRTSTNPVAVPRTVRTQDITVLTSLPAGKMVPIACIPLLREDAARTRCSLSFQMMETADLLINEINVNVKAYLVPNLAFERFTGMDDLNRAYEGKPPRDGMPLVPYFRTHGMPTVAGSGGFYKYLGKHAKPGEMVNAAYLEAYNEVWNYRAKNRSPDITLRGALDDTLAPAFWHHSRFEHIVPDFDQALMDGAIPVQWDRSKQPVHGIHYMDQPLTGTTITDNNTSIPRQATAADGLLSGRKSASPDHNAVFVELANSGLHLTLANIDLARKTQAFAKLREQYKGHDDTYIIDLLMDGITVPEQAWRYPMLLQERSTIFGMSKRYATNGGDLTESVVNGATMIDLNFAVPRCPTGGVIVIVAEVTPGQLFERGRDPYLHALNPELHLPHALRDMLDPEPVEAVRNEYIDIDHATPNDVFGYAPMNHKWNHNAPCVGGRFLRPKVNAGFDEDRLRIWAVETQNPVLSQDFYLATTMHTKPFVNPNQDPFEVTAVGGASITGLTQFGPALIEASDDYEKVLEDAPQDRLEK